MRHSRHRARRSAVLSGALLASAIGIVAACSFPDVSFAPAGSGGEGGTDGALEGSAGDAAQALIEGGDPDARVLTEVEGGRTDAAGCAALDCDCDHDQFNRDDCDAGPDAGPRDCDDNDGRTYPGQTYLAIPAEPPRNGDWNCVGGRENFYAANVDCTKLAAGATCDATFGFSDNPPCGGTGTFVTCKTVGGIGPILASCAVGSKTLNDKMYTQACK